MKIGVFVKEVPDTTTAIQLADDRLSIKSEQIKFIINPYDEFALEEALKMKDAGIATEVVVISLGPDRIQETIRKALAMGADWGVHIQHEAIFCDGLSVARALSGVVKQEEIGLVFAGKQAVDDDAGQIVTLVATELGWGHVVNVSKIALNEDSAMLTREADGGRQELIRLKRPFVMGVTKGMNEPRYPNLKGIMAAKKKEIKLVTLSDLQLAVDSTFEILGYRLPDARGTVKMISGDAKTQASELVRLLREEAKVW